MDDKRNNLGAQSLLVPARGCETTGEAKEYSLFASRHQLTNSRPAMVQGERNRRFYVTMPGYWYDISTNILQVKQVQEDQEDVNTFCISLRRQCDPMPGYPVCLMASGRLKYDCQMDIDGLPDWVRRLMNGQRDCYASWQRDDGLPFCAVTTLNEPSGPVVVHANRSGRGAVYARTAVLGRSGQPVGYSVVRVRLEFEVLDNGPNKDEKLKVKIGRTVTREGVDESPHVNGMDADDQWKQLMAQAQQGFFMSGCQCLPDEVESDRLSIVDQVAKLKMDNEMVQRPRFSDLAAALSWQDALKMINELWQMEVVRRVHLQSAVQPPCRTLLDMIQQHDCQEKRREELRKMALVLVDLQDCF